MTIVVKLDKMSAERYKEIRDWCTFTFGKEARYFGKLAKDQTARWHAVSNLDSQRPSEYMNRRGFDGAEFTFKEDKDATYFSLMWA